MDHARAVYSCDSFSGDVPSVAALSPAAIEYEGRIAALAECVGDRVAPVMQRNRVLPALEVLLAAEACEQVVEPGRRRARLSAGPGYLVGPTLVGSRHGTAAARLTALSGSAFDDQRSA